MTNEKTIGNQTHSCKFLEGFNRLRKANILCDVTLKIDNKTFPAHRNLLVAASEYFRDMFQGEFLESKREIVELEELNPDAFSVLLDYMYSGVLSINETNAGEVLKMAIFLQLRWPKEEACKYLQDYLRPDNALEIWDLARECDCEELQNVANEKILENLEIIMKTNRFKKLDFEKLDKILEHEKTLSTSADIVFTSIIEWMKYDYPKRNPFFMELLKYIKTESVSEDFLKSDILQERFLRDASFLNWMVENFLSRNA